MHIHLDPIGGIAGDMFVAAMLDARPDLQVGLLDALERAGVSALAHLTCRPFTDGTLRGSIVEVVANEQTAAPSDRARHSHHAHAHSHRHYADIVQMLDQSELPHSVREAAQAIFALLAEAESEVHGVEMANVAFHEVGNWDSIADIVSAAWLIDNCHADTWSCSDLPMGSGRVHGAHGVLPVPAPATALLLKGMPLYTDRWAGERITPTGAAILKYLDPDFGPRSTPGLIKVMGNGFGHKQFDGLSNILRMIHFEQAEDVQPKSATHDALDHDEVLVVQFDIDDQTGEDLAVAIDGLREQSGVLDVLQAVMFGKKNRTTVQVQCLVMPQYRESIEHYCFEHTTTIGIRSFRAERAVLRRTQSRVSVGDHAINVKQVTRPSGVVTRKADIDDVRRDALSHRGRQLLRQQAEEVASETSQNNPGDTETKAS